MILAVWSWGHQHACMHAQSNNPVQWPLTKYQKASLSQGQRGALQWLSSSIPLLLHLWPGGAVWAFAAPASSTSREGGRMACLAPADWLMWWESWRILHHPALPCKWQTPFGVGCAQRRGRGRGRGASRVMDMGIGMAAWAHAWSISMGSRAFICLVASILLLHMPWYSPDIDLFWILLIDRSLLCQWHVITPRLEQNCREESYSHHRLGKRIFG
jgi:hypothetical protein